MFWFDIFRFSFAAVFVVLHCALWSGLLREWLRDRRFILPESLRPEPDRPVPDSAGERPLVSVIVPIRNEERRIEGLLRSLALQDYPNAEYIFIDDCSTDRSPEFMRRFAETKPGVKIITLTENTGVNKKQYALCRGTEAAAGTLLLFTDADCEVPSHWIQAMAARMDDPRTGLVIGPVFKKGGGRGFFQHYQCFDHAIRYLYLTGATGIGAASGGFGNNLIVRKAALDRIGGYGRVPPSPTEDAALVSMIRGNTDYTVYAAVKPDLWVTTRGERSWKPLINQTLRWNNGGLFSPDPLTTLNFRFLMVTISMGIIAIPFLPFSPGLWPLPAAVLFSMTMNTLACFALFGAALPGPPILIPIQIIFTPAYFTFLTIIGFCGVKADWKGVPVKKGP
ncbi:MAG: glycosyltransferase [Spirochaetaceae bacterium]|jgi:cellulose synthase/poly-beta-1,6-N-acetylglucosamine synthase-like glycosyltransferase|nr:glycosyltransferase [Spirochaetaceae bacterium]